MRYPSLPPTINAEASTTPMMNNALGGVTCNRNTQRLARNANFRAGCIPTIKC